ncbi:EAL domain-containing protein [Pseudomonas sp. LS44]|nr:EAL domain-containing protein [Pseudomonas sp. LS44]
MAARSRAPVKGALWLLLVLILGVLGWQLQQDFSQRLDNQRQRSQEYSVQLANHMALSMQLKADAGLALFRQIDLSPSADERLLNHLREVFPALHSLVWLTTNGRILADSAGASGDQALLHDLPASLGDRPYHVTLSALADGQLYLTLRQGEPRAPSGYWVVRGGLESIQSTLNAFKQGNHRWLIEDRHSQRVVLRWIGDRLEISNTPLTAEEQRQSLPAIPLAGTDWQLRSLFDERQAAAELLPTFSGQLWLLVICMLLATFALLYLHRSQRGLQAQNMASQRELQRADSVLRSIEECVLTTDHVGRIRYLNPQAEQLFGLSSGASTDKPITDLLPGLAALIEDSQSSVEPQTFSRDGEPRLFAISRSLLDDQGYVWVLRDITERRRAQQAQDEAQRRYQDIFQGCGIALCVLDLAQLHEYLRQQNLRSSADLQRWVQAHPERHAQLMQAIRFSDANEVALRLLGVDSLDQVWRQLIGHRALQPDGIRYQLLAAVLDGRPQLEMESRIVTRLGHERHLWLLLRLPDSSQGHHAVTLSINDITSRKRIELSLIEREAFWSEVVRSLPDTLYVHDISNRRVLFHNHRLGPDLGYSKPELRVMGERMWEKILHPDDQELYQSMRSLQQVLGKGQLLTCQLRWRHRDGSWHWFDIREQALSHDSNGRVSRLIGVAKDITEQIEASQLLQAGEQRYRLLAESISDVIFSTDNQLQLSYISPSAVGMFGYSIERLRSTGFAPALANPQQLDSVHALLEQVRQALGHPQRLAELRRQLPTQLLTLDCLRADGRKIPVELRLSLMWDTHGAFEGLLGMIRDISQQRHAEKELRMAATVFEHSTSAILVTDPAGYIVQVNEAFTRVSGYPAAEVLDQLPGMLTADRQQAQQLHYVLAQLNLQGSWEGELWLKRRNGEPFPSWVGITAVQDAEGDLVSYVCFFSDISERKASEQRIHRLAYYDALTLLPNRTLFQDRLHTALQHAERHREWVVLMFLDLDRFKPINDSLGHAAGDRMLKDVAVRLAACVAEDDTVARMGGDEFTLLLQPRSTREGALNRAVHVAELILASLARPFILEGREFFVTASIGVALSPQDGKELSHLMKNADTAMYHAKERGKNNFQFYQAAMNASALERLELESDLRHALEQNEFVLYYQPQFSGNGRRLTGAEALLRWQHPRRGLVPPGDFIPVLEELGLVVQVGDWVLGEACRQIKAWQKAGIRVPKIAVNLSARQFSEGHLDQQIALILEETRVPPACLELELTESILMRDVQATLETLMDLKRLGVSIAVDDFGTGYSSLNYLKQFPIDVLKIDRSFVDGLPSGDQDAQIARAIIAMAHSLNLAVIAEGVESYAQLEFLREHQCDEVQGYLFGKPMPANQFAAQYGGAALFIFE